MLCFLQADSVFDVIPGDVCSSIILASAAAVSQVHGQQSLRGSLVIHAGKLHVCGPNMS